MRIDLPLCVVLVLLLVVGSLSAQTRPKPKIKDFGSSLKKMKWDPERNAVQDTGDSPSSGSSDDDVIRIETTLVTSSVLVVDKSGNPIKGLQQSDFEVTENDAPQKVGHFVLGDNANVPRSIVLIIDYSGSQFPFIKNSVEAAKVLVDKLGPSDSMAIVTDDVELIVDFTSDKRALKKALDALVKKNEGSKGLLSKSSSRFGKSAQYSALMATLKEAFNSEDERPIIIFQTDGDEALYLRNSIVAPRVPPNLPPEVLIRVQEEVEARLKLISKAMTEFSLDDVYREIEKSRATIYTVVSGTKVMDFPPEEQLRRLKEDDQKHIEAWRSMASPKAREAFDKRNEERLKFVTREIWEQRVDDAVKVQTALAAVGPLSGGWTEFLEYPEQAQSIYSRIFADINQRYIVGYYPTNKNHDGTRRKISVTVKGHPEYTVLGRKFYYAPSR